MIDANVGESSAFPTEKCQCKLLLKMYDSLRNKIESYLKEIRSLNTSAVLATGAIWGWFFIHQDKIKTGLLLFIPAILALLFGVRVYAIRKMIDRVSNHLAKIEREFRISANIGWNQQDQARLEEGKYGLWDTTLGPWMHIYWATIFCTNFTVALACKLGSGSG